MRRSEIQAASALLAMALHDDPGWTHVVSAPRRRQLALRAVIGVAVRDALPFDGVTAAREGERLVAVAVGLPPGCYPLTPRRNVRTVPAMTALALRIPRDIRRLARFGASIDAVFPDDPVWYLQALGVHPERQGRGLGGQLLQRVLAAADDADVPCHLETAEPSNVTYYQRSGFSLITPLTPLYPGGPPMARMTRRVGAGPAAG